jgi:hypothetical protein
MPAGSSVALRNIGLVRAYEKEAAMFCQEAILGHADLLEQTASSNESAATVSSDGSFLFL